VTDAAANNPVQPKRIEHTHIGGQAVLEGIMMRGKYNWAVAVRTPDGEIHTEEHDLESALKKRKWMSWPIVRGCVALVETFSLAMKAFSVSASLAGETEEEQLSPGAISFTMFMGAGLAILLFVVGPAVLTNLVVDQANRPFEWNVIDGILRVIAFFGYVWLIGKMPDIQRVFGYHGAEHKTIHAYEHKLPLEPHIIQRYETLHVRCGTSFLLMVMVVAIIVFSLVPVKYVAIWLGIGNNLGRLAVAILSRIVLLPVVAGLAYEITVKWAGNHADSPFVKVLLWPGMQMQRLTTREPDDGMVEVAVAAMQPVVEREMRERGELPPLQAQSASSAEAEAQPAADSTVDVDPSPVPADGDLT
jgi:uncharacterized protein YqhQ